MERFKRTSYLLRFYQCVSLAASLLVPTSSRAVTELSAEEIFKRYASRVLLITCDVSKDKSTQASGVLVSVDGLVVTNAHVVDGCGTITAISIRGESRRSFEAVLKYYDKQSDTAVLKIPFHDSSYFNLRLRPLRIGERVFAIGNPRGLAQSISDGILSGRRDQDGISGIQHSAPISPGSSGGALISAQGDLLGINSSHLVDSQNLNFAVPVEVLLHAVSSARVRLTEPNPVSHEPEQVSRVQVQFWREAVERGDSSALSSLRKAAEQGNALAQLHLGSLYYQGHGVPEDKARSLAWIRKAAVQGNAEAQTSLAEAYAMGDGVQPDYVQAALWYRKAAEQGDATAQLKLGFSYYEGHGVPLDRAESIAWIRKAAVQGNAEAEGSLGVAYARGDVVPLDYAQAFVWLRRGAGHGDAKTQAALGRFYSTGNGVAQDYTEAAKWYLKAAEQDITSSQLSLGQLYLTGEGVHQDFVEARFWFEVAAERKVTGVKPQEIESLLNYAASHMTNAERSQAQGRARAWIATHPSSQQ